MYFLKNGSVISEMVHVVVQNLKNPISSEDVLQHLSVKIYITVQLTVTKRQRIHGRNDSFGSGSRALKMGFGARICNAAERFAFTSVCVSVMER